MLTDVNTVNLHDERSRTGPVPRRARVRAATEAEILRTAQQLLVEGGTEALTLREVGRQMGMTASALYRYVGGHTDLVDRLTASFYTELGLAIRAAAQQAAPEDAGLAPDEGFEAGLKAAARAFRAWGLAHPAEFDLMFAHVDTASCPLSEIAGEQFGRVFLAASRPGRGRAAGRDPRRPVPRPARPARPRLRADVGAARWARSWSS